MKTNKSVIVDKFKLEIGLGKKSVYRHNQNVLRKLVLNHRRRCQELHTFSKNNGKVSYEAGTGLIFNLIPQQKRLESYHAYDWRKKPRPIYSIPSTSCHVVSVWQQSTYNIHIRKGHRASIFMLLKTGYLQRNDMQTGTTLEEVFLPPKHKFVEMIEDREIGYLFLKSTHFSTSNADIIAAIVVFSFPHLEFVSFFEARKSIFGETAINLEISQGVLLILHSNYTVKLYNLLDIISKFTVTNYKLGDVFEEGSGTCCVGKHPYGLPLNVFITETPPFLLELKTVRHRLQIGGQPWHCIICPSEGKFQICRLRDLETVVGGVLHESDELEDDLVVFHPDETLKIVHTTASSIVIYKVVTESKSKLEKFYCLDAFQPQDLNREKKPNRSSFGRRIFPPKFYETYPSTIAYDYEDELDIFGIMIVRDYEDGKGPKLEVILQDSTSGKILRSILLPDCSWPAIHDSNYSFEMDGLLITVNIKFKNINKMFMFILSENE